MHASPSDSASASTSMGSYHFFLGEREGWVFNDGSVLAGSVQALAAVNGSAAEVAAVLESSVDRQDVQLEGGPMLLRWGDELILIDPGCGTALGEGSGLALARMEAAGFSPDEITIVLFTHLHLDHVGGAIDYVRRAPRFQNARMLACEDEVAFWKSSSPDLSQSALPSQTQAATVREVQDALSILDSQLELFSAGDRLFDDITSLPLPGHTPGHVGFQLRSKHDELIAVGDTFIDPILHIRRPRWIGTSDLRPAMLVETRRTLLRLAARGRKRLFGYHFPFPGFGHIAERETDSFEFVPEGWTWT